MRPVLSIQANPKACGPRLMLATTISARTFVSAVFPDRATYAKMLQMGHHPFLIYLYPVLPALSSVIPWNIKLFSPSPNSDTLAAQKPLRGKCRVANYSRLANSPMIGLFRLIVLGGQLAQDAFGFVDPANVIGLQVAIDKSICRSPPMPAHAVEKPMDFLFSRWL